MGMVQQETGVEFTELSNINTYVNRLYLIEPVLFYGIKYGHIFTKTDMTIKREDMPLLLSDNKVYLEFIPLITKFLVEDINGKGKESGSKKK
jgi:hypothetical protein